MVILHVAADMLNVQAKHPRLLLLESSSQRMELGDSSILLVSLFAFLMMCTRMFTFLNNFCKKNSRMLALFDEWEQQVMFWVGIVQWNACNFSLSLEICVKTLVDKKIVRVHVHAFVDLRGERALSIPASCCFKSTEVHVEKATLMGRDKKKKLNEAHYYLQFPKRGKVLSKTNHMCFADYPVAADWINRQWQKNLISDQDAISEHAKVGQNSKFHIENIEFCARIRKSERLQDKVRRMDAILSTALKAPKIPPKIAEWRGQFDQNLDRYKTLLLWGESQTGKSQFVHAYIPGIREINCQGGITTPDLKDYDEEKDPALFFDEACLKLIVDNKKVFQCINKTVKLGQTTSGMYSYDVYTHKCMMVVANNTFKEDFAALSLSDRNWIRDNVIDVEIKKGDLF